MKTNETLKSLELKALDLDHSVTEAEKEGDTMAAARMLAEAIAAWEAYWKAWDKAHAAAA